VAVADLHTGLGQAGEELVFRPCSGSGGADLPAERDPGWLGPAAPGRLLRLGAGGPPRRDAICRSGRAQAKLALCLLACLSHLEEVVPYLRAQAVLASQRRYQVDVIRSVPDRHPAHPEVIALRGEPSPVHDPPGDLRPFCVRQQPVPRRGPQRTVPDRVS
jgi:hypothetical protein